MHWNTFCIFSEVLLLLRVPILQMHAKDLFIIHLWSLMTEKCHLKQELVTELYSTFVIKLKNLSLCYHVELS